MKTKLVVLVVLPLVLSARPARAVDFEPWTVEQKVLEATFAGLIYLDWRQTISIAGRPGHVEINPALGKHPSEATATRYMLAAALLHAGISAALPSHWRTRWQYVTVGVEYQTVWYNWQLGLTAGF